MFFPHYKLFHAIDWNSSKQARFLFSSMRKEIIAAAETADRGGHMAYCRSKMYVSDRSLPLVLTVDLHWLYSTITTLREGRDYSHVRKSQRLLWFRRDRLHSVDKRHKQISYALANHNMNTFRKLYQTFALGYLDSKILDEAKRVEKDR